MKKYEDALAKIITSSLSGLSVTYAFGTNVFTSHIPDGTNNALAVMFLNQLDENEWEVPKFNVQVVMKSASRSSCQDVLDKLRAEFPKYGATESVSGIKFDMILRRGEGAIVRVTDNGAVAFEMFYNMVAVFKTQ